MDPHQNAPRQHAKRDPPSGRKRTRLACDRCSTLRVRCDGQQPWRGRKPKSANRVQQPQQDREFDSSEADCDLEQSTPHPRPEQSGTYDGQESPGLPTNNQDTVSTHYSSSHSSHHDAVSLDMPADSITAPSFDQLYHVADIQPSYPLPEFDLAVHGAESVHESPTRERASTVTQNLSSRGCRYKCLEPIIPLVHGIIDAKLVCELFELYFVEPGGSLFKCSSPYVLAHVVRKESLLRADNPRTCTPALLVTMLWVSAQTAESSLFLLPGQKAIVCEELRKLMMGLIQGRDRDVWNRTTSGPLVRDLEYATAGDQNRSEYHVGSASTVSPPVPLVDDVLMFILVTIVSSGGDFKTDCLRWWNKALRLSHNMGLNREDSPENSFTQSETSLCTSQTTSCGCRSSLSFNAPLRILDDECQLYAPLSDEAWAALSTGRDPEDATLGSSSHSTMFGAPTRISGIGFFEYFLPLMTILGDVIQLHRQKSHPRFGNIRRPRVNGHEEEDDPATAMIEQVMVQCAQSITDLASAYQVDALDASAIPASQVRTPQCAISPQQSHGDHSRTSNSASHASSHRRYAQAQLVTAYSTFILHVLHVLLHGKWDAVSMLDNKDGWIPSVGFMKCASHAIAASDAMSRILACDPELSFMPYLFGIYLLHGSFILLLFADRMPQLGLNESVEKACEIIIRAHEVCVVTLSTEFQKRFRKVLRSTLYSVRSPATSNLEESKARRRALSLYRWNEGATGLAL
ncbi:Xylanolytic transcriptional activator xlnR [Fusarium oxysporum f. sp. cubense race 1]|uniref:Xylanolytic transcriptional activator xlnR n=1 Tax=Fusarium oxysporum f. sp. cubense (strain race 1) TaxID=1229664 RepID=N4UCS2_FUSC1|nr:Xylanolytic transcriptional activator xlnR [Fusarium oxysporum f. sp. cubense race 1]